MVVSLVNSLTVSLHSKRRWTVNTNDANTIAVCLHYSEGPPYRGDSIGATENAGFDAKVQWNVGLDFVAKQHKPLQTFQPVYSLL